MKLVFTMLLLMQLSACAVLGEKEEHSIHFSYADNARKVALIHKWKIAGRVAIKESSRSWLANIKWQHDELTDVLVIGSSLSGTIANIRYKNERVTIETSDGVRQLKVGESLQSVIGFEPPVKYLKYWVRGLVAPDVPVLNEFGRGQQKHSFQQQGWQVELTKFKFVDGIWLPYKVSISGERGLKIKLVVEDWLN